MIFIVTFVTETNKENIMTLTTQQTEVANELANYIKFKNIVIENSEDLTKAFQSFLTSNFSYNYFKDEDFRNNANREIKKQLN